MTDSCMFLHGDGLPGMLEDDRQQYCMFLHGDGLPGMLEDDRQLYVF